MKKVLITGMAGFIGYHLAKELMNTYEIVGIDNLCGSYDIGLKIDRLKELGFYEVNDVIQSSEIYSNLKFAKIDLLDDYKLEDLFLEFNFDYVINLAAYAGLLDSVKNPKNYISNNIVGFANIIELSSKYEVKHFLYASSSSVYGYSEEETFSSDQSCEKPLNLYATSKKANELIAHTYGNIHNLPTTGLRFFNVYGEYGRPDMAPTIFASAIRKGLPIYLNNKGDMHRDLVYVKDIVFSISKLMTNIPEKDTDLKLCSSKVAPYRVLNIGSGNSIKISDFVELIATKLDKKAIIVDKEYHKGEALKTLANTEPLEEIISFKPQFKLENGIDRFLEWHISYYKGQK